jgi:iron complex transport system ATP-binding protein
MAEQPALISLDRVELRTPSRVLVRDLSLAVEPGQRWAVLGPNGAGKSTLLAAMAGARAVDAGTVRIAAQPIRSLPEHELAMRRALVTDRWSDPFSSTVLDTVLTARFVFRDDAAESDRVVRILDEFDAAHLIDEDVRRLSRGERQRVAIVTALAQSTPLVLLDEPTAHQDPRHQALVIDRLVALGRRGLVASLHDLNAAARFATHALLLDGRGACRAGTAAAILTPAALTDLFGSPIARLDADGEHVFHVRPSR